MKAQTLRDELRRRLEENRERVLLRILLRGGVPAELTGGEILARAESLVERYAVAPEQGVVLLLLPHSIEIFLLHIGLVLAGRLPAILPWPTNRIDPEKYQRNLLHQLRHLPAQQLITLPRLAGNLGPGLPFPATACPIENAAEMEKNFSIPLALELPEAAESLPGQTARPGETPAAALFLQFSGGTTGAQKAVVVTAPMLVHQLARLRDMLAFTQEDGVVSWLPLYHDMGLIACLWMPLWHAAPSAQMSASDWLLRPELLFQFLERYRATFCWLPNFAFSYMAAQRERIKGEYSLEHMRAWINCSEPVRQRSFREFQSTFSAWGVRTEALQASYAMAENVFAVTQTPLGVAPATFLRSRLRHRAAGLTENAFDLLDDVYVSSGEILADMEVRVTNLNGGVCGEGEPGNVELRTPCLFDGYWTSNGFVRSAISGDGWYSTGDYGFLAEGNLYVIGRCKDVIIVGGQNVFPEDVETVVNSVEGVYPGRVVAFGVVDEQYLTESLAIVAEMRGEFEREKAQAMERQVSKLVLSTIGLAPRYVAVVPERWIVKSTAGKISRRDTRERFLQDRLRQGKPAEV